MQSLALSAASSADSSFLRLLNKEEIRWSESFVYGAHLRGLLQRTPVATALLAADEPIDWINSHLDGAHLDGSHQHGKSRMIQSEARSQSIWVLGLGTGKWIKSVTGWLQADPQRLLLIVEPDIACIGRFFQEGVEPWRFSHQIALIYVDSGKLEGVNLGLQLAGKLLCDSEALGLLHPHYQGERMRGLGRKIRQVIDDIRGLKRHYLLLPDRLAHCLRNAPDIPTSRSHLDLGQWIDCPVVLCGAGPSLSEAIPKLKKLKGQALIVSCGTASLALQTAGIEPDYLAAVCPFDLHEERFRKLDFLETPLLTALTVHPGVIRLSGHQKVIVAGLGSPTPAESVESLLMGEIQADGDYGPSVLTSALRALVEMGARSIALVGVDLCYVDSRRYASGAPLISSPQADPQAEEEKASFEERWVTNHLGERVLSEWEWLDERAWLENYFKNHPELQVMHSSLQSAVIEGAPYGEIEAWLAGAVTRDRSSLSWMNYQNGKPALLSCESSSLSAHSDNAPFLQGVMGELWNSFQSVIDYIYKLLEQIRHLKPPTEEAIAALQEAYNLYIQQQISYAVFLKGIDVAISCAQSREVWNLNHHPKWSRPELRGWRVAALASERLSTLAWRLSQLQAALEDTARQQGWV